MDFIWPTTLWLFALVALLPLVYLWHLRRRSRALKFANLDLIRQAVAGKSSLRRHLPPVLFFLAMVVMVGALARPSAMVTLPSDRATIVLAMDISGSMRAQDVSPSRIDAAQHAVRTFIANQPRNVRIGIAAFAANGFIAQMPTLNREDLIAALDSLQLQRRTAVGSGLVAALQAIFPDLDFTPQAYAEDPRAVPLGQATEMPKTADPVPPGSYKSAAIILLSDGRTNAGIPPIEAAQFAADRGVRVFTVGFGSPQGVTAGFEGGNMRMALDEVALKKIAEITKGKYHNAQNGAELEEIYRNLSSEFVSETKRMELTGMVAAPALVFLVLAAVLSLMWSNRMAA